MVKLPKVVVRRPKVISHWLRLGVSFETMQVAMSSDFEFPLQELLFRNLFAAPWSGLYGMRAKRAKGNSSSAGKTYD